MSDRVREIIDKEIWDTEESTLLGVDGRGDRVFKTRNGLYFYVTDGAYTDALEIMPIDEDRAYHLLEDELTIDELIELFNLPYA